MVTKTRLDYIDVSKGILISMMIFGHIDNTARTFSSTNEYINTICSIECLWTPFFMCAFFVITGYCSNFDKQFKPFFIKNIRTILIPSILISFILGKLSLIVAGDYTVGNFISIDYKWYILFGGPLWFLSCMFLSKMLYWFVKRFVRCDFYRRIILLILFLGGFCLDYYSIGPNFWYYHQSLMLLLFLEFGGLLKSLNGLGKFGIMSIIVYSISIIVLLFLSDFAKTGIYKRIAINWITFIPCLVAALSGSLTLLCISQKITNNVILKILKYVGKNSLLFIAFKNSL